MSLPVWPDFESHTLLDGQKNLTGHAPYAFPGYIADPSVIFLPMHVLTYPGTDIAPGIARYCMGDGPDEFTKNRQEMGADWHYATKEVRYHCNSDGYRAPEWNQIDWPNSIVLLGCSMTFGVGVSEDETISYYLNELTGRPVINLGYPAGSNELILNNLAALANRLPMPWAVVVNWSTLDRFTYYNKYFSNIGLWTNEKAEVNGVNLGKLYKARNYCELNKMMENYYLAKCAQAICQGRTRYHTLSYFAQTAHYMRTDSYVDISNLKKQERARDGIHPGPYQNKTAAQSIYDRIVNL